MYNWTHLLDGPEKTNTTLWADSGSDIFVAWRTQNSDILDQIKLFRLDVYKYYTCGHFLL